MVEFALTAPLFVMLVFGIIELGILFSVYVGLTNSAREASRAAAVYRWDGATPISTDATGINTIDTARLAAFTDTLSATMNPIIATSAVTVEVAYLPAPGRAYQQPAGAALPYDLSNPLRAGDTVSVTLQHSHRLFFGVLGPRDLLIRASGAARIEPGGAN
jgi:Flp pilus assembly protein TadG